MVESLYSIQLTPYGGRGAYACKDIKEGTCILRCTEPYAYVIMRKFKKEVCAWCFSYAFEHGTNAWRWKYEAKNPTGAYELPDQERKTENQTYRLKKGRNSSTGVNLAGAWFCSADCRTKWCFEMDAGGLHAILIGTLEKVQATASDKNRGSTDIPASASHSISNKEASFPLLRNLQSFWIHSTDALLSASLEDSAGHSNADDSIINSCQMQLDIAWRQAELVRNPGKQRNAHREKPLTELELDIARFVISALLRCFREGKAGQSSCVTWSDMLKLQNNEVETALHKPEILASHLRVYCTVRNVVETALKTPGTGLEAAHDWNDLLVYVRKSDYIRALLGRDHGNVFGIWDMASQGDSEMLGWAMYVEGSYFNHGALFEIPGPPKSHENLDCCPNIKKKRAGRALEFYAIRDIGIGEELCTTYIDVEELALQRRAELKEQWYFDCACARCHRELRAAGEDNVISSDEPIIDSGYVSLVDI